MKSLGLIIIAVVGFFSFIMAPPDPTLENLQEAYQDEANAARKYRAYADKAREEGYKGIAKLFDAVSESETIHMENHKNVIIGMGAQPDPLDNENVEPKSTKENLAEPIRNEKEEFDKTYPEFISQAKDENNEKAVKTFTYARDAEMQHQELFKEALNDMNKFPEADFYVSRISGATYMMEPKQKAPEEQSDYEEYIKVD